MKNTLLLLLSFTTLGLTPLEPSVQDDLCPSIVEAALQATAGACEGTGRNQVCYGNVLLQAEPQPGVDPLTFSQQGDIADVATIRTLSLSSMDVDAGEWGVALMRIQANLPDTLPGQNVTMLLFGDVAIENAVEPGTAPLQLAVTASSNANVRAAPSTNATIIGGLQAGQTVTATGRLADSSWLRIELPDGSTGWVFTDLIAGDISSLDVVSPTDGPPPESPFGPMQAFYFRSGIGDAPCAGAPDSGILIQTPEGAGEITLQVNEVNITLSSTVYLQAQAPGDMVINGIERQAHVEAFDITQTALAGTRVRVPLNENSAPSGPPTTPEPYDRQRLLDLPLQYLDRPVPLPPALTQAQIDTQSTPTAAPGQAFTDDANDVMTCQSRSPVTDPEVDIVQVRAGVDASRNLMAEVQLAQPLVNDFSFAVLLIVGRGDVFKGYLWEVHDRVLRIGEIDLQTGELIPGSEQRVNIQHDRARGLVSFDIPAPELADLSGPVSQIGVRSFHTPSPDTATNCDFAGPYDLQ